MTTKNDLSFIINIYINDHHEAIIEAILAEQKINNFYTLLEYYQHG
jgi:hypothetical protein